MPLPNEAPESSKAMPLVTVYIPTRNRSKLLARAVQSVLDQTYPDLEVIVVDDASEDDTEEVVQQLIDANETTRHIRYFRLDRPSGACVARNVAIEAATGRFITGLDDDDYFAPDRIARLVQAFDPAASSFVFGGFFSEIEVAGMNIKVPVHSRRKAVLRELLKKNVVGNQVLTLTERMRAVGGFDSALLAWQDHDLWIRLARSFGEGHAAGGLSYVHTADESVIRISSDLARVSKAYEIFKSKHPEYSDPWLDSCLRLGMARYGINTLRFHDVRNILLLGDPLLGLSALYRLLRNAWRGGK